MIPRTDTPALPAGAPRSGHSNGHNVFDYSLRFRRVIRQLRLLWRAVRSCRRSPRSIDASPIVVNNRGAPDKSFYYTGARSRATEYFGSLSNNIGPAEKRPRVVPNYKLNIKRDVERAAATGGPGTSRDPIGTPPTGVARKKLLVAERYLQSISTMFELPSIRGMPLRGGGEGDRERESSQGAWLRLLSGDITLFSRPVDYSRHLIHLANIRG